MIKLTEVAIGFCIVATLAGFAFYIGYDFASDDLKMVRAELDRVKKENDLEIVRQKGVQDATEKKWQSVVAEYNRNPRIRVHTDCGSPAVPKADWSSGQFKGASGKFEFSTGLHAPGEVQGGFSLKKSENEISVEQCEDVANKAVKDAAQILWMIDFNEKLTTATE